LFFIAAASALSGRTLVAAELQRLTTEDTADSISLDVAVDRAERDRLRLRRGGAAAEAAIRAGCVFFDQARRATHARWSGRLTPYDGLLAGMDEHLGRRLDPTHAAQPVSASRLASFARCGFLYLLRHVLHLEAIAEPIERWRLDPLERGDLFHRVAERFLRERRERGELPLSERPETLARLLALAGIALDEFVASQPPRLTILWERVRARFQEDLARWLQRETVAEAQAVPLHFEVTFGSSRAPDTNEPHLREPLSIDLGDGRALRVQGRIDRIDRRTDGALILRDYKTGRIPRDDGQLFRSGAQMQIPFYILAAARLFPGQRVAAAYLDFVDGGREVAVDPLAVTGDSFRRFVRDLVDAMTEGLFVQDASACGRCDFVEVCGPAALIDRRYQLKSRDPRLQRVRRLRETL
jgi:RecB family exonuclease